VSISVVGVLVGTKEIASVIGIHRARICKLVLHGAPIRVITHGKRKDERGKRYLADKDKLIAWVRCENNG
jgi:hypothetical protein